MSKEDIKNGLANIPTQMKEGVVLAVTAATRHEKDLSQEERDKVKSLMDHDDQLLSFAIVGLFMMEMASDIIKEEDEQEYKIIG